MLLRGCTDSPHGSGLTVSPQKHTQSVHLGSPKFMLISKTQQFCPLASSPGRVRDGPPSKKPSLMARPLHKIDQLAPLSSLPPSPAPALLWWATQLLHLPSRYGSTTWGAVCVIIIFVSPALSSSAMPPKPGELLSAKEPDFCLCVFNSTQGTRTQMVNKESPLALAVTTCPARPPGPRGNGRGSHSMGAMIARWGRHPCSSSAAAHGKQEHRAWSS